MKHTHIAIHIVPAVGVIELIHAESYARAWKNLLDRNGFECPARVLMSDPKELKRLMIEHAKAIKNTRWHGHIFGVASLKSNIFHDLVDERLADENFDTLWSWTFPEDVWNSEEPEFIPK